MLYEIVSVVVIPKLGKTTFKYEEQFADDENVFSRMSKYHERMNKMFKGCSYKVISCNPVIKNKKNLR